MGTRGLSELRAGDRYTADLPTGQRVSGIVQLWQPPHQFAATVEQFNNAYLRADTRCLGDAGAPWIWLSTYGVPADNVRVVEHAWQATLDQALDSIL